MLKTDSQNIMMQKEAFAAIGPLLRAALPYLGRGATELAKEYAVEKMMGYVTNLVKKQGADAVAKAMLRSTGKDGDISNLLRAYVSGGGKKTSEIGQLISALGDSGGSSGEPKRLGPKKSLWSLMSGVSGGGSGGGPSGSNARWNPSPEIRLAFAASTNSEPWIQAAKAEGIPDDIIEKIEGLPLVNKLFFCRVMKNDEIEPAHFGQEAAVIDARIEQLKVGLAPRRVDEYNSLRELDAAMDMVEKGFKNRMGSLEHKAFETDKMDVVRRFALKNFPAMVVYRYNDWDNHHPLLENSNKFCIGTMQGFDCKKMLRDYGGEVFIFVRDGKQWAIMAPHNDSNNAFTTISNTPLTPCERAICIIAVYDLADKWKGKLSEYMSDCASEGFSEAFAYLDALPEDREKEIKKNLMSRGMHSLYLTLLLETQSGIIELTKSNEEIINSAKQLIKEGNFHWENALKPLVYKVSSENGARVAMDALALAIDTVRRKALQDLKRAKHDGQIPEPTEPHTDEQKQFIVKTFAEWEKLRQLLESREWREQIISAAAHARFNDFLKLYRNAIKYDELILRNYNIDTALEHMIKDLKELMPYVIAHETRIQSEEALGHVFGTGNPHTIGAAYERQLRGATQHRQTQGGGLVWADMESYIAEMVLSGSALSDVRNMLVPYLHAVENPKDRLALMAAAIKNSAPENAEKMVERLELAAGEKVGS